MENNKFTDAIADGIEDTKVRFTKFFTPTKIVTTIISLIIFAVCIVTICLGGDAKIAELNVYVASIFYSIAWISGGVFGGHVVDLILALTLRGSSRAITVEKLIHSLLKYIVAIVVAIGLLIVWLGEEYIAGVLGGVGVLALVIGLGAQKLIGDIIAGVFMVFEGNIKVGDWVTIGDFRGEVKEIGIRSTILVSDVGDKKVITNSAISEFINLSDESSYAIVTTTIHYSIKEEDTRKVVMDNLQRMKEYSPLFLTVPVYKGVESMGDNGYVIKVLTTCKEEDIYQARRDLTKVLMDVLEENNIELAYPHVDVVTREN